MLVLVLVFEDAGKSGVVVLPVVNPCMCRQHIASAKYFYTKVAQGRFEVN